MDLKETVASRPPILGVNNINSLLGPVRLATAIVLPRNSALTRAEKHFTVASGGRRHVFYQHRSSSSLLSEVRFVL